MRHKFTKKGVFYVFVVLLFLAITLIIFYTYDSYNITDKTKSTESRIRTMNDFINDFNSDVDRATKISATRALLAMEDYVVSNNRFFTNIAATQDAFKELFYNGTLSNVEVSIMENSTFTAYAHKVDLNARNINMVFAINVTSITLVQTDPWYLKVIINSSIQLIDGNISSWYYNQTFITNISIEELRDPLYSLNTEGKIYNVIQRTPTTNFVVLSDATNLSNHAINSWYTNSTDAPSYLMRFYNDLSSSSAGIESMVNLQKFSDQGLSTNTARSVIDYRYFSSSSPNADICFVQGMPSWFRINHADKDRYQIVAPLNWTGC